ncbi:putative beta-1,3-galactosyltransferase 13 [Camellia lanceoleosa]|nr:putative beta-1,3-galactosyltransferase 13 [Camellia lanceoleosa]
MHLIVVAVLGAAYTLPLRFYKSSNSVVKKARTQIRNKQQILSQIQARSILPLLEGKKMFLELQGQGTFHTGLFWQKSSSAEGERLKEATNIESLSTLGYELLSDFIGREYFIHGYDPIYTLFTNVVSSFVALRREASEDEIQDTRNFLI